MNKIHSKYQKKNLEEREYNLDEFSCPHCDNVFMIDFSYLPLIYDSDEDEYLFKITCPYCSHKTMIYAG